VTNDVETIAAVAMQLLRDNAPERPVRLLGVRVAGFAEPTCEAHEVELTLLSQ
jgi:hypothetical protein